VAAESALNRRGEDLAPSAAKRLSAWLRGYRPIQGIPDELFDAAGRPRGDWLSFLGDFAEYPEGEHQSRFDLATRHIRDTGVSYRIYGEETEQSWPLNPLPLILGQAEWREIAAGVEQRANLMEALLQDIYGEAALVKVICRPPPSPAASTSCRSCAACRRPAAAICSSTPPTSGAALTAAGGCSTTAPRRPPARATPWRTGWCSPGPTRISTTP